jgi:HEAT repeat protein/putative zinc finger protein
MECRELTELAVANLSGGLDHSGQRELADHLEGCPACREENQRIEGVWKKLGEDPDRSMSPEFRRRSLALIEDEMLRRRVREFAPRRRWIALAAQAAAVLVAASMGWFAHRPATPSGAAPAAGSALPLDGTLSNVTYRQADPDGKVAVSFDVTSHRTVTGRPQDPALAGLLAYLVSQGTRTAGEKSQAIDLVSSHFGTGAQTASPEVVHALTTTLRRDPNPGVRKKAADALAGFPMAPEIRSAFFEALAKDTNPAVRLAAVDALAAAAKQAPDARTIQSLRERAVDPEENGFVRAKAASALKAVEF